MKMRLRHIPVRLSEIKFSYDETEVLVAYSLGSCVGVALWDPEYKVGGMAHVFLPYSRRRTGKGPVGEQGETVVPGFAGCNRRHIGKYGERAVPYLVSGLLKMGCRRENLMASIAGGASVIMGLSPPFGDIGLLNSLAVQESLTKEKIKIAGKDIGGNHGRTVRLYIGSGRVTVSSIHHPETDL
jgi:chemotaxis protein CheD